MKHRYILIYLIVIIGTCYFFFTSFYNQAKQEAIRNVNNEQLLHARHAARGIEDFFNNWTRILTSLSESRPIINMDETGKENIKLLYTANQDKIRAITRVDADGRIVYTFPFNSSAIGRNISQQEHIREVMRTHKPVVSDVFFAVQGYDTVALHVPVFRNQTYKGTIAITINFQTLAKRYLEDIKIGNTGYAWVISRDGTELYCPVPGHTGNSVFENCKDFPSILVMAQDMLKGHQGLTTYTFDKIRADEVEIIKKHAVYLPIKLDNTFWSVVVASSEDEIIASLQDFRNKLIMVIGLLLLGGVLFSYYGLKAWFIIGEEEKRYQTEEALRESERKYRELVETANSIILRMDSNGIVTFFNEYASQFFGFSHDEIIGRNVVGTIVPPTDSAGKDLAQMILDIGVHPELYKSNENENMCKDGTRVWAAWTNKPILDDQGRCVEILCIGNDITDRKRAEDTLRGNEERFRAFMDNMPSMVIIKDKELKPLFFNRRFNEMFPAEEWLGKIPEETFTPEIANSMRANDLKALLEGSITYEEEWHDKDHCLRVLETRKFAIAQKDKAPLLGVIITDNTDRRKAEEALQKSEQHFRAIFNSTFQFTGLMTPGGILIEANQTALDFAGIKLEDIINQPFWEARWWRGDETRVAQLKEAISRAAKGEFIRYEVELQGAGDTTAIIDFSLKPVLGQDGEIALLIPEGRDITESKQAMEELGKNKIRLSRAEIISRSGNWEFDMGSKRVFTSDGAQKIYGLLNAEWTIPEVQKIPLPEYRDMLDKALHDLIEANRPYDVEFKIRRPDTGEIVDIHSVAEYNRDRNVVFGIIQDITERKRMEETLRISERQLSDVIDFLPDATLAIDSEKKIIVWNKAIERMTGIRAEDMIGKGNHEYTIPFYGERRPQLMDLIWENDQNIIEKYPQITREGESLSAEAFCNALYGGRGARVFAKVSPLHDPDGNVVGAIESVRDIEEHKRAEEALHQREETLRIVFKTTPVGLCIMKDRVFQSVNNAWYENLGYSESEIIGHTPRMLYETEGEYERVGRELFGGLSERGLTSVQTTHRQKNGGIRDVVLTAVPLKLVGSSSGMVLVTVEDVTDRKRAMDELNESQRQLADIIEFLPDATLILDKDEKVVAWNRAIESMTGVKKEDMLGKGNHEYSIPFYGDRRPILIDLALHPDKEREKRYTAIQRVGDILFGESYTPNLPPGDIHLSATASVLRDSRGEIIAAIECIRDNTERKRLEEQLNRAEKMEGLGRLAGGVAHDLNNVLGVLVGYSELLAEKLPADSLLKRYAVNIQQSSMRGAAIIQDLLTLARRGVTVSEVVDLNRVIFDYLRTPEFEALKSHHPHVKIWTELEEGLLNIKGSPIHLGKTIMNLISNASEAISEEGEVTIRTENRYLDQPIRGYDDVQEGDYVVLTVSDSGRGISSQDIGKIFEPFYTKKVMGRSGTGLGLAVVWGTVKDHHGYIDVQSEVGKGTTFTLYFPVTREEVAKATETVSQSMYMGRGESILVVDDVQEQRELAVSMLGRLGYQVEALSSGEEAVVYLKDKKVDLVVLDMIMDPGIDGLETYRRILKFKLKQKAIIVSGFSETDRVKKALEMGAGSFVRKPYILEKIGLAVKEELDRT
jgi:two-component system, cell cycle sensor histidine kinase and response regulator CckA